MRSAVGAAVFRVIQVAWAPLAMIGYGLFVIKALMFTRRSGVSATTLASLHTRWMQHRLGTRIDEPCARLMAVLPNVSQPGLRLVTEGTLVAHRLTGYVPPIYRYPYEGEPPMAHQPAARTTFFDTALARHQDRIDQLVVLGAGWDTRAFRMPPRIRCFEVDSPRTHEAKRRALQRSGLDVGRVTLVPADFMTEDWMERLVDAGFEPGRRTFFLWESVTMYLDRAAVESTLRAIAGTAPGTAVAFDYFNAELIEVPSLFMRYARAVVNAIGEPFRFGIDSTPPVARRVAAFLASCGLSMEEQRNFGRETDRTAAKAGFTTALVPG